MDKTKWKCDKIDNIANILNGYAFKSNFYCNHGIRIIRITNVQDGYIDDTEPKFYPLSFNKEISKYLLYENDLLISLTGNVGRVAFLPKQMLPAALNQRVACIRLKNDKVISLKFLYHFMMNIKFKDDCIRNSKGVAQLNMSTEWLKSYNITFPPLSEQRGIASELDAVQIMIDGYKAQLADLDALAQSIFLDMFGDPIANPKGWKKKKIQDVCIVNPSKHEIDDLIADDEEVSFLPMEDLGLYALHFTPRQSKTLLKVKTAYTYFKEGDIVMAKVTPCFENGKIGIATKLKKGIGFGSSELLVYRSKGEIIQVYSYFVLSSDSFHALGHKNMNGVAGLKRLTKRVSNELQIPIPPLSLQQRFAAKIEAIEKQKELLRQQLSDAETLMAERMQYYFS